MASCSLRLHAGTTLALALAALGGAGCGADATSQRKPPAETGGAPAQVIEPSPAPPEKRPFRAATFNAGLAVGVLDHAEARVDPVVQSLAEAPLELLCVQEFWLEDHFKMLLAATADKLPYMHRLPPAPAETSRCAEGELEPLITCAARACGAAPPAGAPQCLIQRCLEPLTHLSGPCMSCLGQDPRRPVGEIVRGCSGAPPARRPKAKGREEFYAYGGSFGTGILTSAPILERDARVFPSSLTRRGVLYAKLEAPVGRVHAFCTHLTTDAGKAVHPRGGSWAEDQAREIDALLAFIDEKSQGGPVVLLGDLNTGSARGPAVRPRLPALFARLTGAGLKDPFDLAAEARCTYCFDNPLQGGAGTYGILIDHVLLRGLTGRVSGELMRRPLDLDVRGRKVHTGFSDHYGVVVELLDQGA